MEPELAARLIHSADERDARRRPRARRRVPPRGRAARWRSRARAALARGRVRADRGVPARARLLRAGRRGRSRPTSISATASRSRSAATTAPAPPEPCPLPARGRGRPGRVRARLSPGTRRGWRVGADAGPRPTTRRRSRRCATAIARGDVYQVNLVQHLAAPFDGDPRGLALRSRRCGRFAPRTLAGDGWAIVSASPELFLARRGRRVWTMPIKGTRPARRARRGREGRRRARDDRRPRAQRPLARLRAGLACAGRS